MSALVHDRKRKRPAPKPALKSKKLRRAAAYHSSSSEDEAEPLKNPVAEETLAEIDAGEQSENGSDDQDLQVHLQNDRDEGKKSEPEEAEVVREVEADGIPDAGSEDASLVSEVEDDSDEDEDDEYEDEDEEESIASASGPRKKPKRRDPAVFANSMQRILSSKLTTTKRADPVLSRSVKAHDASKELNEQKLDKAARQKLRAEKKAQKEKGRVTDLLGLNAMNVNTGEVMEKEKQLRRTAQKGVVKLFNAVKAAQMSALQAEKEVQGEENKIVGMDSRKKKIDEMSKQGFLDLLAGGTTNGT